MDKEHLIERVLGLEAGLTAEEKSDCPAVRLPSARLLEIMTRLKQEEGLSFDFLLSHTAVHWPESREFELFYRLYSTSQRQHLLILTNVSEDSPQVDSVSGIWRIAEWQEREVYDLFGVQYGGHPDLRRLFLDDDWQGHPLRKDYKDDFMLEGE